MKAWHIGVLTAGALVAGGVAAWMTQAPSLPVTPVAASTPVSEPARVASPAFTPPSPLPSRVQVSGSASTSSAAPPPVYEALPPPPKPKPFRTVGPPVAAAAPRLAPVVPPVPYQRPPVAAPPAVAAPAPPSAPAATQTRHVTLLPGQVIAVRPGPLSGDTFQGSLAEPLEVDGLVIAERGARVTGRVINQFGATHLSLGTVDTSDGQHVPIASDPTVPAGGVVRFRVITSVTVTERRL